MARRLFAILLASAIAGCSGGGGGLLPGSRSSVQSTGSIHISLTLGAPSTAKAIARGRNYISYSTRGLSMQIATHGQTISSGTIKTLDVSPGNANCVTSGNQRQCGWTIANLAPGWIDMQLSLWDTAPANGTSPAGTLLSQSTVVTAKIDGGASVYPSFTTIAPIISGAQLSLQPATLAYGSSGITTLYIALLDPQRNIIIDDGTGSTLEKTLTVSSTGTAAPTSSYNCSSGGSAILTTTSYTTIPAATGDAIHTTGCLTSSQIAVTYGTTLLATTTLNVTGLGAEAPLNSVMYPFGGGLQSAMASDGKVWTFSASATEPAQSLDPLTGATSSVYNNTFGGCCGAPAPTSNVLLGSDGNFYFFGSGNSGPVAQQFQPATQSYATCYLSYPGASYSTKITSIAQTSDGTLWGTDAANGLIVEVPASSVTTGCSTITPATVAQPLQPAPPTVVTQSGNSATLPTGTYSVKIQWQDYSGLTATSPATQITITNAGDSLLVSAPPNYSGRGLGTAANGYNVLVDSGSGYVQLSNADCQNGSASGAIPLYVNCLIESVTSTATPAPATSTTHAHPASILNDNGTLYVSDATAGTISTLSSGTFTPLAFANTAESYMPNLAAIDSDHIAYEELPGDNGGLYRIGVLELAGLHQADFSLISSQEFSAPGSLIVAGNGGMYYVSQDGSGNTGIEHAVCACAPNAAPVFNTSPTFTPAGFQTNATLYGIVADKTGSLWIPESYGSNASLVRFMLP